MFVGFVYLVGSTGREQEAEQSREGTRRRQRQNIRLASMDRVGRIGNDVVSFC